jgi:UDP-glucose 4-epimerase
MSYVLLTGGAGYIGSHTALALLMAGEQVISFDNYSNPSPESLKRIEQLTGKSIIQIQGDVLDTAALAAVFEQYPIKAVVHFAGLKAVGESTQKPLWYYETNVGGSIKLCQVMAKFGVKNLVFSSSATVYGDAQNSPLPETTPTVAMNPYGQSKLMTEWVLRDLHQSNHSWNIAVLRYFNPVGTDASGRIGEDPNGIPNNLMPFITQVAVGKRSELQIFCKDYPTTDGTGVRDYIHVTDLAAGHVAALQHFFTGSGFDVFNLGVSVTRTPHSSFS